MLLLPYQALHGTDADTCDFKLEDVYAFRYPRMSHQKTNTPAVIRLPVFVEVQKGRDYSVTYAQTYRAILTSVV